MTIEKYNEHLNSMFLKNCNNNLLLELQFCSSNPTASTKIIFENLYQAEFDTKSFGILLLIELKSIYSKNTMNIIEFGKRAYSLWKELPSNIQLEEPFRTLSYADDPLSWGDEKQTRYIYKKLFSFYSHNEK